MKILKVLARVKDIPPYIKSLFPRINGRSNIIADKIIFINSKIVKESFLYENIRILEMIKIRPMKNSKTASAEYKNPCSIVEFS